MSFLRCSAVVLAGASLFAACGGSDNAAVTNPGGDGGGSDASINGDDSGGSAGDASGGGDDAGDITDGGANFGDGGAGDGGDFPDGGTCNRTDMGDVIMSDCSAFTPLNFGGAIVTGTYTLTKVTDLGSLMFCSKSFTAVPFQGGLVVGPGLTSGSYAFALALDGNDTGRRSYTWSVTPASTNKSPLSISQSCPGAATFTLPYNAQSLGKQTLEIVAPYGSGGGTATYHFEKN